MDHFGLKGMAARTVLSISLAATLTPLGGAAAFADDRASARDAVYDQGVAEFAAAFQDAARERQERLYVPPERDSAASGEGFRLPVGEEQPLYVPDADRAPAADAAARSASLLPASYTAPYTSVKDQGLANTCWAFAVTGALESAYLKQAGSTEQGTDAVDFSEAQLVYGSFNGKTADGTPDGPELTDSDNDHLIARDGGYGFLTAASWIQPAGALAAGRGVSFEEDVPTLVILDEVDLGPLVNEMARSAAANYDASRIRLDSVERAADPFTSVQGGTGLVRTLDEDALSAVKQLIYEKGALFAACYVDPDPTSPRYHAGSEGSEDGTSSDSAPGPFDVPANYWAYDADAPNGVEGPFATNHCVAVVGWDDAYSRWNFATPLLDDAGVERAYDENNAVVEEGADGQLYILPKIDGAWVVKNSWGENTFLAGPDGQKVPFNMGDDGMFYFSFCEKTLTEFAAFELDGASDGNSYDIVQQYDGVYPTACLHYNAPGDSANVFTAEQRQEVQAVGVWAASRGSGSDITVSVYADLADPCDPESGTLASQQTYRGAPDDWYTFQLDRPVTVDAGETYSVVVRQACDMGGTTEYAFPAEHTTDNTPVQFYCQEGESYGKYVAPDGSVRWLDMQDVAKAEGAEGTVGNATIKAFANPAPESSGPGAGDEEGDGGDVTPPDDEVEPSGQPSDVPAAPSAGSGDAAGAPDQGAAAAVGQSTTVQGLPRTGDALAAAAWALGGSAAAAAFAAVALKAGLFARRKEDE